jgi:uncharacterized membrane protein YphA (DoxX/SURF4 family)
LDAVLKTAAPSPVFLIRLMVGAVILSEGIQKFLFPNARGVGRFIKIGIPSPEVLAPLVGVVEICGGALILLGLLTRLAAIPEMAHESRTDFAMLIGSLFLLIVGAGSWSVDGRITRKATGT